VGAILVAADMAGGISVGAAILAEVISEGDISEAGISEAAILEAAILEAAMASRISAGVIMAVRGFLPTRFHTAVSEEVTPLRRTTVKTSARSETLPSGRPASATR
jgi:hypothetical protein